jgi:hypothetical protein
MGKFITRMRPGDAALQRWIFAEAHRLYEAKSPLSQAIRRLLDIAGDNPNAFRGFTGKNTKGLNRTSEGRAILNLVGMASAERDHSDRVGVMLPSLRRYSAEEKALAAMPIAESFRLLSNQDPRLLDAEAKARRLADDHSGDSDGGAALRRAIAHLVTEVLAPLAHKSAERNGLSSADLVVHSVVAEYLGRFGRTDAYPYKARAGSWWPHGD